MPHANAPLTRTGRHRIVRLVEEKGLTFEVAAAASNVAKSTVYLWVSRWRAASPGERSTLACLEDRSSRPRHSPTRLSTADHDRLCELRRRTGWGPRLIASEVGLAHATVHRALRRRGCSRRPRVPREAAHRYRWPCPGNLLHMDTKRHARFERPGHAVTGDRTRRSPGAGFEWVHTVVDDCSRLAYAEVHADERASTVTAFTERALDFFLGQGIVAERLLTDNHFSYTKNRGVRGYFKPLTCGAPCSPPVVQWGAPRGALRDLLRRRVADFGALYGSLGALMALLLFVFAVSNVLVFGAELASEWSRLPGRRGGSPARPAGAAAGDVPVVRWSRFAGYATDVLALLPAGRYAGDACPTNSSKRAFPRSTLTARFRSTPRGTSGGRTPAASAARIPAGRRARRRRGG